MFSGLRLLTRKETCFDECWLPSSAPTLRSAMHAAAFPARNRWCPAERSFARFSPALEDPTHRFRVSHASAGNLV
jgi:hypothetical protein